MKKYGIWIDKRNAKITTFSKNNEDYTILESGVEDYHPSGGSGTKQKGGPQDVVQDSKYTEREKHQLSAFFKDITSHLKDAEAIVIYGPAETGYEFKKELSNNYKDLYNKVADMKTADSMTDHQTVAWARDYFES